MIRGLYTAASGMITRQIQLENLSNNIANINTPGFKKDEMALKSFDELLIENRDRQIGSKSFRRVLGTMEFGVGIDESKTNFSQGIIEDTDRDLDFAINGDGFFTVLGEDGTERYTRNGRFQINQDGYLATMEGNIILGIDENGRKTPIKLLNDNITLSKDGTIENSEGNVKFCISRFDNVSDLIKEGNNMFKSVNEASSVSSGNVSQKALEKSNVDAIESVTQMISIMRSYESSQKVVQQMDETLGKTVNEVGSIR
ncbi:flagellar basal-body rod protein FlgF [Fonticella tunisiensis]|uniref:Flagellar basal-body rod protein FlgG n=1 Tax=Fonticella tunisiensis TaxID=1096341 RepID=A0A4R7KA96_9CLOT|nr:flagellar basal-body rod protein FlgF [Fonticella tunisiensis]TDT50589.1 flagellar basal-body rod protein FlgG [Fonticella tunisiensis]